MNTLFWDTLYIINIILTRISYLHEYVFLTQACIDVREAVVFWATLRTLTEMEVLPPEIPWISSHPSHGNRENNLNEMMTKVLEIRKDSGVSYSAHTFINIVRWCIVHLVNHLL